MNLHASERRRTRVLGPKVGPSLKTVVLFAATLWLSAATQLGFAQERVTIRFANAAGGENLALLNRIVRDFEAKNPHIRIKVEPIVQNFENKLLAMIAARTAPDIAVMRPGYFERFANRRVLLPLNSFPDFDSPEVDVAGRYPNIVEAFTVDGNLYALPIDVVSSAYIFYNKRLFREAGIPFPDGSWTWDTKVRPELREKDFVWVMQQLTKRRPGQRRPYQYGFVTAWPQLWLNTLLISSDVRIVDDERKPTQLFLDDPAVVEIFQFASDTINKYNWMPSNNEVFLGAGSTMQDEFRKGRIAMLQSGAWEIRDMRSKMREEWDIAPFPTFARGTTRNLPGEGGGLAILASSRHPKEAWEFVKYLAGEPGLTLIAQAGETQPSIRRLALTPGVWLPAPGATGAAAMPANLAITDDGSMRVKFQPFPEYFATGVWRQIQGMSYGVLSGENDPARSLARAQRNLPKQLELALTRTDAPPFPTGKAWAVGILIVLALLSWIFVPALKQRRGLTQSARAENRTAYKFLIPWFCGLALTIGPMVYSLILSFAESDIIQPPRWRGLGNYADIFNPAIDDTLWISMRQTFIFTALSVPIGIATALALALLLNQKVRGVPLFRALYYMPSLASAVAMSLIWMRLFDRDRGLINAILYGPDGEGGFLRIGPFLSMLAGTPGEPINWLGNTQTVIPAFVIMGMWGAGGGTIIFLAGLQGISQTYYEAATLDGAGIWRRFRSVTLPLLTPTIFFSMITGIIGALQVFSQSFVMTGGGPDRATYFMVIWLWSTAFEQLRMGYASAIAWILFVVVLIFTVIQLALAKKWVFYEGGLK